VYAFIPFIEQFRPVIVCKSAIVKVEIQGPPYYGVILT